MTGPAGGPLALAAGVRTGVSAAVGRDEQGLTEAVDRLSAADAESVRLVVGHVVRSLVEELHPDGVDGDDVAQLLRAADTDASWCPEVDATVLLTVVAGALGVHAQDEDDARPVRIPEQQVARHALLLVATLLRRRAAEGDARPGAGASARDLEPYLQAAMDELRRAQTIEMP